MAERAKLIQEFKQARANLLAAIDAIDGERVTIDRWNIKDILSHIAGWDETILVSLKAHLEGTAFRPETFYEIDRYNDQVVAERATLPFDRVLEELHALRAELLAIIENMPQDKFDQSLTFSWGETYNVAVLLQVLSEHEEEHALEIREIISVD